MLLSVTVYEIHAQVVDTVCPSIPYGNYGVKGGQNSAYFWDVTGGQIVQSNGKDTISVQWDFAQPDFKLSVVEVSSSGCIGDTIYAYIAKGLDPAIFVVGSDSLCVGNTTLLTAYGGMDYLWSTGVTNPTIAPKIMFDSTFFVIGRDGCGLDTAFYSVTALNPPTADFSYSPTKLVEDETAIFSFTGSGATHFQWYFDDIQHQVDNFEVMFSFKDAGVHRVFLYVESAYQCSDTISKMLLVESNRTNSFTPNNDGVNDVWEIPELAEYPNCRVWIFDRSGAEVFYSQGYLEPWDGTMDGKSLPMGSYYYIIDYGVENYSIKGIITILK